MKSHVEFGNEELKAAKGALHLFKDALTSNPKLVPMGRPWNDNERKARIEHLDYIAQLFTEMESGKNSITIDGVIICFDLSENEIFAIYSCCEYAASYLSKTGQNQDILESLNKLVNNFKLIGVEKLAMVFEYE